MGITIDIDLVLFILAVLGCVALVFLIIFLKKLSILITNIDNLVNQNSTNIGFTIAKLPGLIDNIDSVVDNAKDVTDVAVDVSADVLSAKEKIKTGISSTSTVLNVLKSSFKK